MLCATSGVRRGTVATQRTSNGACRGDLMHRRMFLRALGTAWLAFRMPSPAFAAAEAATRSTLHDHPLIGRVWDVGQQRFVSMDVLRERVIASDFRLLGEIHDNPDHHAIQAELLESIGAHGVRPVVAFEQLDRDFDAALTQRLATGAASAEDVAEVAGFDREGWNWEFYRPLVAIALRYGMPIRAANLSRSAASQIAKKGWEALGPTRVAALHLESAWSAERDGALRDIIREGHCGALPEAVVPSLAAAQRARDATLAESLLARDRDGAVLIAGDGHVRRDLGVPIYLSAAGADRVCAVGILEVEDGRESPADYARSAALPVPLYDFACFTARRTRPDPCADFQRRK